MVFMIRSISSCRYYMFSIFFPLFFCFHGGPKSPLVPCVSKRTSLLSLFAMFSSLLLQLSCLQHCIYPCCLPISVLHLYVWIELHLQQNILLFCISIFWSSTGISSYLLFLQWTVYYFLFLFGFILLSIHCIYLNSQQGWRAMLDFILVRRQSRPLRPIKIVP